MFTTPTLARRVVTVAAGGLCAASGFAVTTAPAQAGVLCDGLRICGKVVVSPSSATGVRVQADNGSWITVRPGHKSTEVMRDANAIRIPARASRLRVSFTTRDGRVSPAPGRTARRYSIPDGYVMHATVRRVG